MSCEKCTIAVVATMFILISLKLRRGYYDITATQNTHFFTYHLPYVIRLQTELLPPVVDVADISQRAS